MPLPASPHRTEIHLRSVEMRGYRRDDGLYEIDGRVVDTKSEPITLLSGEVRAAGAPIHDMSVRLVVDGDLVVHDVIAVTDATPFPVCALRKATSLWLRPSSGTLRFPATPRWKAIRADGP